jgi:hypothetical protein
LARKQLARRDLPEIAQAARIPPGQANHREALAMPALLDSNSIGPVDVAVIRFEGQEFSGDVAPALAELDRNGTVHIIDLAFVRKHADESVSCVEVGDDGVTTAFDQLADSQFDLLSDTDLDKIAGGLEPDSSAMVIVWENSWAARLAAAIRGARGLLVGQERIPRDAVLQAIAALDER